MEIQIAAQKFYEYSLYMKGFSPTTIKRYKYVINFYCRFARIKLFSEVTGSNITDLFLKGRTERKWSSNTFIVFYKSLKVFFAWCLKEGYLQSNPVAEIVKPKLQQKLPVKLTQQETVKLLEIVKHYPWEHRFLRVRNHAIFSTFVFAGLRLKELLNLRFSDIDLENKTIFINQGKGNKDRVIPINSTLADTLQEYLNERKRLHKTCPEFFVSYRQNTRFTESGMKKLVEKIKKVSGLRFSVHKLRHTFATLMLEGGCDIYSLSRMMGHSDIKTTTIYLSATTEHLRAQIIKHPLNHTSAVALLA